MRPWPACVRLCVFFLKVPLPFNSMTFPRRFPPESVAHGIEALEQRLDVIVCVFRVSPILAGYISRYMCLKTHPFPGFCSLKHSLPSTFLHVKCPRLAPKNPYCGIFIGRAPRVPPLLFLGFWLIVTHSFFSDIQPIVLVFQES